MALSAGCASEESARTSAPQASSPAEHAAADVARAETPKDPIRIEVPGTTVALIFRTVPAGAIEHPGLPAGSAATRVEVASFSIATTETTWDMYDAFVFALDRAKDETDPPDAWARPSKPYILMDRGFGHAGHPAISVSFRGATEFCRWLSARTHSTIRLPTEDEWLRASEIGGDAASDVDARAWCAENSEIEMRLSTHPIATKTADALGLFDVLGNAAEWTVGAGGQGIARGGSFKDPAAKLATSTRRADDRALNATDPQIPKSLWWLADGGFIGFRVVLEGPDSPSAGR
jgi:formylglycine-generating enzyme required for sulfatase activity